MDFQGDRADELPDEAAGRAGEESEDEDSTIELFRAAERGPDSAAAPLLARRYEIRGKLDSGGSGVVFHGWDRLADRPVAIKVIHGYDPHRFQRIRDEISTLRLLRIPGVVRMIDEEVEGDLFHIVMELVDGDRFPGSRGRMDWSEFRPLLERLLETIVRVHGSSVIHRDLKPGNVLVTREGEVVVLDFGLSALRESSPRRTEPGGFVGTPAYMAPEQVLGARGDERSDLYAIGVMAFEALTGHLPFRGRREEILSAKLGGRTPLLGEADLDIPADTADLLDRLLRRDPDDRPRSALDVLAGIGGSRELGAPDDGIPFLGRAEQLDSAMEALLDGMSIEVVGPRGSGRTRFLRELERRLSERSIDTFRLPDPETPCTPESISAAEEAVRGGAVLLVDDVPDLLPEIREGVAAIHSRGRTVRVGGEVHGGSDPVIELPAALTQRDLHPLFHGPDRIFHLAEDASAELFRRTDGAPRAVAQEVESWVRSRAARWDGGRLRVERSSLEGLSAGLRFPGEAESESVGTGADATDQEFLAAVEIAGPQARLGIVSRLLGVPEAVSLERIRSLVEAGLLHRRSDGSLVIQERGFASRWDRDRTRDAHRTMAEALPGGADGRLVHVILGELHDEVAGESISAARAAVSVGRVDQAIAVLTEGLRVVRRQARESSEDPILREMLRWAMESGTTRALDHFLYESGRSGAQEVTETLVEKIGRAALDALGGDARRGLERMDALGALSDPVLEKLRHSIRLSAARRLDPDLHARRVQEASEWAASRGDPETESWIFGHKGWVHYSVGRYTRAAEMHRRAMRGGGNTLAKLSASSNAASALMESGEYSDARELAEQARALAAVRRHALAEARAESLLRQIAYRANDPLAVDDTLVDVVARLGVPHLAATVALTESAVAWRNGEFDRARTLAQRASQDWSTTGQVLPRLLPDALSIASGAQASDGEIRVLVEESRRCRVPDVGAQALGLLAIGRPERAEEFRRCARRCAEEVPRSLWALRREVLSIDECIGPSPDPGCPGGNGPTNE